MEQAARKRKHPVTGKNVRGAGKNEWDRIGKVSRWVWDFYVVLKQVDLLSATLWITRKDKLPRLSATLLITQKDT